MKNNRGDEQQMKDKHGYRIDYIEIVVVFEIEKGNGNRYYVQMSKSGIWAGVSNNPRIDCEDWMKANTCQEENPRCTIVTATSTRWRIADKIKVLLLVIFREADDNPNTIHFKDIMHDHKLKSLQAAVYTIRKGLGREIGGKYSLFVLWMETWSRTCKMQVQLY